MNPYPRTIFISLFSGVEAKGILRTNVLPTLLAREGVRLVLFLKSKERVEFYRSEFNDPRIIYEVVSQYRFGQLDPIFEFFKHYLLRTKSLSLYKRLMFLDRRNYFIYWGSSALSWVLGHRAFRRLSRLFDYYCCRDQIFSPYVERYQPDLVFLANLFDNAEISFLREAKRRQIPTIGYINSWDKITAKGFVRLLPDILIVPSEIVKEEAITYVDMPAQKIVVAGVPQYDLYANTDNILPREEFFRQKDLDPSTKLIIYSPMGTAMSNSDWKMIDILHDIITHNLFFPSSLLVRFPPNDFFENTEKEFASRPWLCFDLPGTRFSTKRGMDWDMTGKELLHLKNTLYHADLVIGYATSLSVDAAVFDKPVINLNFEVLEGEPAQKTPTLRYSTEHYSKALRTGGIRLVGSKKELVEWIHRYLEDPRLDHEARKRLVQEQCYITDGKAGERIGKAVLSLLK